MRLFSQHNTRGFTVIELLVVIAIIAVLATITVGSVSYLVNKAKVTRVKSDIQEFLKVELAAEGSTGKQLFTLIGNPAYSGGCWRKDLRNISVSDPCYALWVGALQTLQNNSGGVTGIAGTMNRDPWGSPYVITPPAPPPDCYDGWIQSAGPDGQTDDAGSGSGVEVDDIKVYLHQWPGC